MRTGSMSSSLVAFNPVLCFEDCEQYEQSSVQPPVLLMIQET